MKSDARLHIPRIARVETSDGYMFAFDADDTLLFTTQNQTVLDVYTALPVDLQALSEDINATLTKQHLIITKLVAANQRLILETMPNGGYNGVTH